MNVYGEISLQALHSPSELFFFRGVVFFVWLGFFRLGFFFPDFFFFFFFFLEDRPGCLSVSKWYSLPVYLCAEGCRCKDRAMRNPPWEVFHAERQAPVLCSFSKCVGHV